MRAPRALLPVQEYGEPAEMPATDRAPSVRVLPKHHMSDGDPESRSSTQSLVSGSSRSAQDGSAATLEHPPPGSTRPQTPGPDIHEDCKGRLFTGQELPGPALSIQELGSTDYVRERSDDAADRYDVP